jgi:hypothetical protein
MKNFDFNNGIFSFVVLYDNSSVTTHQTSYLRIKKKFLNNGISKQVTKLTAQMVFTRMKVKILP